MRNIGVIDKDTSFLVRLVLTVAVLNIAIITAAGQKITPSSGLLPGAQTRDPQSMSENSDGAINLSTNLVSVAVTITDRDGRAIAGLHKEDFRIFDDKAQQTISFFSEEDTPASVAIVFDTSESISGRAIERAKEALARFIQTSHPQDEFFLIGFGSRPQLLLEKERDGQAVLDKFTYVHPAGDTALYDAVEMALGELSKGSYHKHAIILISDGEENNSRTGSSQLDRNLEESGAVVYTVRVGNLPLPKSTGGMVMDQIANLSGGKSFWPDNSQRMDEAFEQIALDLRRQYSIGYLPANFVADGRLHKIKVVLSNPGDKSRDVIVRNRQGYYAIAQFPVR
jgi:Ca-activated chloride channel homolog